MVIKIIKLLAFFKNEITVMKRFSATTAIFPPLLIYVKFKYFNSISPKA